MTSTGRTIFDSLGVYLPPKEVTTDEIVSGCVQKISLPLARLTGIRSRHRAGDDEFAIDLAEKAVRDCMSRGSLVSSDVDLLVSTNISRWDGRNQVFFEPPTSLRVKQRLGLTQAMTIDISNACAGMWTGVFIVDALIRSGAIRRGIVVSGEYITHLIDTAQREITDFMDSQVASLTLGDAGVAVSLSRGNSEQNGLIDFDLYTLSKFSRFCTAKPTDKCGGGAAMHTDSIKVSEAVIPHAAKHAQSVLDKNAWGESQINHVIPHQTSELTMRAGLREIRRMMQFDLSDRLINNLANRGNTSSNAHFLALHDSIHNQKINSGDSIVFCISGSGQSTGTALYVMDDLPDRMRSPATTQSNGSAYGTFVMPMQIEIESLAVIDGDATCEGDSIDMMAAAAIKCLSDSQYEKLEIDLVIAACTYRSEFIMEPAIAALVAGQLEMNDAREPHDVGKTFAFDVTNGEVGFLKSIYLAGELIRAGRARQAMVLASEVENNVTRRPTQLLGVRSMASALVLRESQGEAGFFDFLFREYPEFHDLTHRYAAWDDAGRVGLDFYQKDELHYRFLECVMDTVVAMVEQSGFSLDEVQWIIPPQISRRFVQSFSEGIAKLSASPSELSKRIVSLVDHGQIGDPMSSTIPLALSTGKRSGTMKAGDIVLCASVSPGIQVGTAMYRV